MILEQMAAPAAEPRRPAALVKANRLLIDMLGRVSSAAVSSRLPLYRPMAIQGQVRPVGTATVRGIRLRLLIEDYCDYAVFKSWETVEPATLDWIDAMPAGSRMLDIGANIGRFALYAAARHGGRVRVAAVEPDARVAYRLAQSVALNGLDSLVTNLIAGASDSDGNVRMVFDTRVKQGHLGRTAGQAAGFSYVVQTLKIDSMIARGLIEPPTHIKIDVDDHEVRVLDGALETLRSPEMRSVLVEVDAETRGAAEAILLEAGYTYSSEARLTSGLQNLVYVK